MAPKQDIDLTQVFDSRGFNVVELAHGILDNHLEKDLLKFAVVQEVWCYRALDE